MKKLQRFCVTAVLTLTLALSVFAGEIGTAGIRDPEPRTSAAASETGDSGTTALDEITDADEVAVLDPMTEAALNLIKNILSLF